MKYRTMKIAQIATLCLMGLGVATAAAAAVGNPGAVEWTLNPGSEFRVNTQDTFALGGAGSTSVLASDIDQEGAIVLPASRIKFDPIDVTALGLAFKVQLVPISDGVGSLDPVTGLMVVNARFKVSIGGSVLLPATCAIPELAIQGRSDGVGGAPYDATTGTVALVDTAFAVPEAADCGFLTGAINSQLKLPSESGLNSLVLKLTANPIVVVPPRVGPGSGPQASR
jgi:hypothetical protein